MKFINENAAAITVFLLAVSMAVAATVWIVTEINDVRDDLSDTERRLTEKINENAAGIAENAAGIAENAAGIAENAAGIAENAAGIAEINERLDSIDQRLDLVLEAIANHSHTEGGTTQFTKPTAEENPTGAENENPSAQR